MQKIQAISPHVVEHRRSLKMHHVVLQSFFSYYQKIEQVKWMAMWQEQESGVRNFSIIELAKDW
jgi:hypothetical protein